MSDTEHLSVQQATDLVDAAFRAASVPAPVARSVAVALVTAEAEGQVGHGFSRVEDYIAQVRSGKIAANAEVSTHLAGTTSLLVDAGHGFAYPALDRAIEEGGHLALKHGCATMGIYRSHHCGALSIQVERLARKGLVAIMVANAPASMAPWGGNEPIFGTNPIAFAAPRGETDPLVIDLSLSKVARGKIMNARKSGKPIPEGWALDRNGQPTTDPVAALEGTMVPIGEAKGTALALMVEILSTVMVGAARSTEASSFFSADGPPPAVGQFLIAMKPMDQSGFEGRLQQMLEEIAAMEGARVPGTRRIATRKMAEKGGLDVPLHYIQAIRAIIADGT
ncbi:Ldh family oxidoreductase [Roseibium sediminis]|uniref:Ldh family oxidoreductase n=1 Tax=Roseibium sediminis TaxID=1775174 RepID=UPI00123DBEA3|nr:Ldh family oxidoreductase [Roseibium sediminis]